MVNNIQKITPASSGALQIMNPPQVADPSQFGYSTAVITPLSGRLAFISGQMGADENGNLSPDFETQVTQSYDNLLAILTAIGGRPD